MSSRTKYKYLLQMFFATLFIWIVLIPVVTSGNVRIDSDYMIFSPDEALAQYSGAGRPGMIHLLRLFGLTRWRPILSGILFLLFFTGTGIILCHHLRLLLHPQSSLPVILFYLLFSTSPTWAYHGYFVLQLAPIGFGLFLSALLASADMQQQTGSVLRLWQRVLYDAIAIFVLCFVLSIYQALGVFYITAFFALLLCAMLQGQKYSLRSFLGWVIRILLSIAAYVLFIKLTKGATSDYATGYIEWGSMPLLRSLAYIAIEFGKILLLRHSAYFSLYPAGLIMLFLLLRRRKERSFPMYVIAVVFSLLPMSMSVFLGGKTVPRTQYALQLTSSLLPLCFLTSPGGRRRAVHILCITVILIQSILILRLAWTDHVRNDQDTQSARILAAEMADMDAESKPLIFLGKRSFAGSPPLTEVCDVYGRSMFEWVYDENLPGSASVSAVRLLRAIDQRNYHADYSPEQLKTAIAIAEDMPCFPETGSVLETDSIIVIKLSAQTGITP